VAFACAIWAVEAASDILNARYNPRHRVGRP
jgi:hypothetical protein